MKRIFILIGLLSALTTGVAAAQTRVGVSISLGDPYVAGQVVIGGPIYHRYAHPHYYRYRPAPVIVVSPRYYRAPRVVVVRPSPYRPHRYHRGW